MPFCTLKPSWYLRSGRLMRTVVTGGQLTRLSLTCVCCFRPCKRHSHLSAVSGRALDPPNNPRGSPAWRVAGKECDFGEGPRGARAQARSAPGKVGQSQGSSQARGVDGSGTRAGSWQGPTRIIQSGLSSAPTLEGKVVGERQEGLVTNLVTNLTLAPALEGTSDPHVPSEVAEQKTPGPQYWEGPG